MSFEIPLVEIWSAKSISRVICPPSGIVKSQQSVALSRSLSVSYRRELRAPFALCGSHSARGFVSARAPSSAPCLTTHTPIATTAKEVLNNLVYSTPVAFLVLRKTGRKIQTIVTEFQFNTPKLYRVKHGKDAAQEKRQHAHYIQLSFTMNLFGLEKAR